MTMAQVSGAAHTAARVELRPHTLVASILAPSAAEAVAALGRLPPEVGLAEVRLDGTWPTVPGADRATDDLLALVDAANAASAPLPLLATLRPRRQGGRFDGAEQVRLGLLQAALRAGFAFADLEMDGLDASGRVGLLRQDGGVVASAHLPDTPCRSDGLNALLQMHDVGAAYDKLAFTAGAFPDLLRAFELARTHAERRDHGARRRRDARPAAARREPRDVRRRARPRPRRPRPAHGRRLGRPMAPLGPRTRRPRPVRRPAGPVARRPGHAGRP